MAPRYNLINDFGGGDNITASAYWIVAIIPLGEPFTFSRATMSSVNEKQAHKALSDNSNILVITDDCVGLSISNSKGQATKNLNATLKQSETNYLVKILPGDWVMAWMFQNQTDYDRVLSNLGELKPCNEWDPAGGKSDGLKFIGRAHSIRKSLAINGGSGTKTISYSFQAIGFRELETQIFYDPALASQDFAENQIGSWAKRIGLGLDDLFINSTGTNVEDNVNIIAPKILELIVGAGVGSELINPAKEFGLAPAFGGGSSEGAPFAYLVPKTVGDLLGLSSRSPNLAGGILAYSDIISFISGVQKYEGNRFVPHLEAEDTRDFGATREFIGPIISDSGLLRTSDRMLGHFIVQLPTLVNTPLWQLMHQFLNPTINELYSCLRISPSGKVLPTVIMRQIPFTTDSFSAVEDSAVASDVASVATTRFSDLPRWVLDSVLVSSVDIGRSDATRTNFIHVYGDAANSAGSFNTTLQLAENQPIRDDVDVQRCGARTYVTTVACSIKNTLAKAPRVWMRLIADWMIGSQYTLNGTISCLGIQSPICEGDNLQWDGVIYHIESITHNCSIDFSGTKQFRTTITLTNGMRALAEGDQPFERFPIYPGIIEADNTQYDPNTNLDAKIQSNNKILETQVMAQSTVNSNGTAADSAGDEVFLPSVVKRERR